MTIRVYYMSGEDCVPCQDVRDLLQEGRVELGDGMTPTEKVDLIDIETDEGYEQFFSEVLQHQDAGIPWAIQEGQKCDILLDDERRVVIFKCPSDSPVAPP